jgi:hypothetical protein
VFSTCLSGESRNRAQLCDCQSGKVKNPCRCQQTQQVSSQKVPGETTSWKNYHVKKKSWDTTTILKCTICLKVPGDTTIWKVSSDTIIYSRKYHMVLWSKKVSKHTLIRKGIPTYSFLKPFAEMINTPADVHLPLLCPKISILSNT